LKEDILANLREVIDPETGLDVVSMGLITHLSVSGDGDVELKFRPSSPFCPLGFRLAFDIREAVKKTSGVKKVNLEVVNFVYADRLNKLLKESEGGVKSDYG